MKLIGYTLACIVAAPRLLAEQGGEATPPNKISSRLASEIRASLPKYVPPATGTPSKTEPSTPSDADILVLPKVVVQERAPTRVNSNDLLTAKALSKKLARDFKNSLTGLDAVLNDFSLPLISPSMEARGRAAYKAQRMEDLNGFVQSAGAPDQKSGEEMRKAVIEMNKAEDWQNR